jgi:hypothetical protein
MITVGMQAGIGLVIIYGVIKDQQLNTEIGNMM